MGTLAKFILGGLALFLAIGGPRLLKKGDPDQPGTPAVTETAPQSDKPSPAAASSGGAPLSGTVPLDFAGQPDNLISTTQWLAENGKLTREMQAANLTYYLLARSDRCHPDSLRPCVREKIQAANIDQREFQYTYFLDRVLLAGSGQLFWEGKAYFVNYVQLRKAGWASGERDFKNNYYCSSFSFRSKKPIEFIRQNISNKAVFTTFEEAPFPNGATASGQHAVNWHTVSVNPLDFPLSVPDEKRRAALQKRWADGKRWAPAARSFIVLITKDRRMFLTEASDTGGGVKPGWIDWRIGNTSAEIKYFHAIGSPVKAICYTFTDPNITFEQVLANSKPLAIK